MKLLLTSLLLCIAMSVGAVPYINHERGCKVDFPCAFESDTSSISFTHLKVKSIRLSATEEVETPLVKFNIIYRFICEQFYPTPKNVSPADLMTAMKIYSKKMNEASFLANNQTVLEQKQSTFKNLPAIDYKLEMKDTGLIEYRKVIFKKDKIYALSFECLKPLIQTDKLNAFFNSFELIQ